MKDDNQSNLKIFLFSKFYNEISSFYKYINNNKYSTDRWEFTIIRKNFYFQKLKLKSINYYELSKGPENDEQNYGFFFIQNSYSKSYMHREFIQMGQFCHNDLHKTQKINFLADKFTKTVTHIF